MQKTEAPERGFGWVCMSSISPPTTREGNIVFDPGNILSVGALLPPMHVCGHACLHQSFRLLPVLCFSFSVCREQGSGCVGLLLEGF